MTIFKHFETMNDNEKIHLTLGGIGSTAKTICRS